MPIWLNKVDLQPSPQAKEMMAAIKLVPASSSVTASRSLSYGLSRRSNFFLIDNKKFTDYVVIDTISYEYKDPLYQEYLAGIAASETYSQIYNQNHIQVYMNLANSTLDQF